MQKFCTKKNLFDSKIVIGLNYLSKFVQCLVLAHYNQKKGVRMSAQVWELLDRKGRDVFGVPATATAYEAVTVMAEHNIGCVLAFNQSGTLAGLCAERDVFRKVLLARKNPSNVSVRAVMTPSRKLITVTPQTTLTECMDIISEKRVRHLPVLDEAGQVVGMISIGDVVKTLSSEKELMIRQLEHYISGSL